MRTIIKIEHVEQFEAKDGKKHWRTYALLDDGTEAVGYGKDYDLDNLVEVFFHYGQVKMRRPSLDKH